MGSYFAVVQGPTPAPEFPRFAVQELPDGRVRVRWDIDPESYDTLDIDIAYVPIVAALKRLAEFANEKLDEERNRLRGTTGEGG